MEDFDKLLEKNPKAREIYEQNRAKLERIGWPAMRRPPDTDLAPPYSDQRPTIRWRPMAGTEKDRSA